MDDFAGKTVVVTGAGDGTGRTSANQFAKAGAAVVVIEVKNVDETVKELSAHGHAVVGVTMDVRDGAAWTRVAEGTLAKFGRIDALVNNAGIVIAGDRVVDTTEDMWDRMLDINAKSAFLGMKAVLPSMIANRAGKICNVASTAARIGLKDAAAYCDSKGAVLALTRQAGVQYAPFNIQINSASPGTTMTPSRAPCGPPPLTIPATCISCRSKAPPSTSRRSLPAPGRAPRRPAIIPASSWASAALRRRWASARHWAKSRRTSR